MSDRARAFLEDAHRNGHKGPVLLRRWAMARNGDRRDPRKYVTVAVIDEAIRLESEVADDLAGVDR